MTEKTKKEIIEKIKELLVKLQREEKTSPIIIEERLIDIFKKI